MPLGLETVHAFVSAAAATGFQALAAGTTQSLSIRASNGQAPVYLEAFWANADAAGVVTLRSPRLHDNVQGILAEYATSNPSPLADEGFEQTLYSQDTLTVGINFTAAPTAGHLEGVGLQVAYTDIPGIAANLRTWAEVQPNILEYVGIQASPTTAATTGSWGAGVAINSTYDLLKANQLYAILGYEVSAPVTCIAIQGPDTGNLLYGGPGAVNGIDTRRWFVYQDEVNGFPSIPVINSANKQSTQVNVASSAASTQYTITLLAARLSA